MPAFHPEQPFNSQGRAQPSAPTHNEHRTPNGGLNALTYVRRAVSQHLYPWI